MKITKNFKKLKKNIVYIYVGTFRLVLDSLHKITAKFIEERRLLCKI